MSISPDPRSIVGRLQALEGRNEELGKQIDGLASQIDGLQSRLGTLQIDLGGALRALGANETLNRARVAAVRDDPDYRRAWDEDRPLVSVTVATIGRPELVSRSLPSILAQGYGELEVVVAGDGAPPETADAVAALGDPRVRYLDLGPRQPLSDDPVKLWLVGATRPRNASLQEARGRWIVEFDDDDALRPDCIESLLELARGSDAEAVYGQVRQHVGDDHVEFCAFPPRIGHFSWAAGMYHAGLRFFGREQLAADLGLPGDWWLAERMLRAGVRFAMRDEVLCDAYMSGRLQKGLEQGRIPWTDGETGGWWG